MSDGRVHVPWPVIGLLVTIGLPSIMGFYWLGQLSEIVKGQGQLITKLDTRIGEFEVSSRRQEERDRRQDEAAAAFRLEIMQRLAEQTAVLREQGADLRAIRENVVRQTQPPGLLGPR